MPYKNLEQHRCPECGMIVGIPMRNSSGLAPVKCTTHKKSCSGTSMLIAVEEIPNQEYGQHLQVVLGKESYAKERNDGFFTRVRRASGDGGEWAGHYNMSLMEATVDFTTRLGGTGDALQMLNEQIRDIKR